MKSRIMTQQDYIDFQRYAQSRDGLTDTESKIVMAEIIKLRKIVDSRPLYSKLNKLITKWNLPAHNFDCSIPPEDQDMVMNAQDCALELMECISTGE
jgi:hypothetical protein